DKNGWLDADERQAARKAQGEGRGQRGRRFGPPGGMGGRGEEPVKPGPQVAKTDFKPSDAPLYAPHVVRTIFIDFESNDWEAEMADFYRTDVDVPATITVDGKTYPQVGVQFRGMSSFGMVGAGHKRSMNLSMDLVNKDQRLLGYKTLNLLNAHEDSSFMHPVLYNQIAQHYLPTPKANFVKVVVNGESWGLYVNTQQFNKDFLAEYFPSSKGARWKVPGSPGGRGGLNYLGEDPAAYKGIYQIKSNDSEKSWKALANLCKVLNETPLDQLEAALDPILDIDGALWFLAMENVMINGDGYWVRASDYSIYLDEKHRFHILPHDTNETFGLPMGPGMGGRGGPGPGDSVAARAVLEASAAVQVDREGVGLSDRMMVLANPVVNDEGPTVTRMVPAKNAPVMDAPSVPMARASRVVRKVAAIARNAVVNVAVNVVANVARVVADREAVVVPVDLAGLAVPAEWGRGVWNSTR
ncbi:MAG: CotH kinase family protein, partial [Planctomycetota bacterium]|nr:CotH kinase family protein [Planctomycetota bacterium]